MYTKETPITDVPLIGDAKSSLLDRLEIRTVRDLLFHVPSKYKDSRETVSIVDFKQLKQGTILAKVVDIKNSYLRNRRVITRAKLEDETGTIYALWFNQPYLTKNIKPGLTYYFNGKIANKEGARDISSPEYEIYKEDQEQIHLGKLSPSYPETAGISSKWLRGRVKDVLKSIENIITDPIPTDILTELKLTPLAQSIQLIHKPEKEEDITIARERLMFDEMLSVALNIENQKRSRTDLTSPKIENDKTKILEFISALPFSLTLDQEVAVKEILDDISLTKPMHRLLNGDVGSGKTIVALIAMYATYLSGHSSVLMAPTSILAQQHYKTISTLMKKLKVPVELEISSKKIIKTGSRKIVIGTHALLYNPDVLENVGLVVVDEQHRFGVEQREKISTAKNGTTPHYLSMSATPIPRTLTNILFGDMDVSFIREQPKDRKPVITHYVPKEKIASCYQWIVDEIQQSKLEKQAFIIFPLVDESEKVEAKSAKKEYERLTSGVLKGLKVALLHGQMKDSEKEKILNDFKKKKYSVLVATPVVEVGIDIPDAAYIVIENSERFGLAQLHQFRGRVGRGVHQSYCFVLSEADDPLVSDRLTYFSKHISGFDVSEYDLERRGPGEVYGKKQSGIPNFKIASITDIKLLLKCRKIAKRLIDDDWNSEIILDNLFK